jgi:DNA-binding beta-propeller fold protein YncE
MMVPVMRFVVLAFLLSVGACTASTESPAAPKAIEREGKELGIGDHSPASVTFTVIAEGLKNPTDLAFNPRVSGELWIVNHGNNEMVIVHDAPTDERRFERRLDAGRDHFLDQPNAIAFGADPTTFGSVGTFGTCGESRNARGSQDPNMPNDFMGPVLWTSDLSVFAKKNPARLGSHIDMLHSSPQCMGMTHERDNVYWVFGGQSNSIQRYDFAKDHNVGQDDHTDGSIAWYAQGQFARKEGIPSHLAFRAEDSMVYIADTGNSRIAKLDTTSGKRAKTAPQKETLVESSLMDDTVVVEDVVGKAEGVLQEPSGLELRGNLIYVSDNATSKIHAFSLVGAPVNYLDTGLAAGALGGMAFGPDGKLYIVDMIEGRVLRIDTK